MIEVKLRAKLTAGALRQNLVRASLFLSAFELLKADIISGLREFYLVDVDLSSAATDRYREDVLSLAKYPLEASARWLVKHSAITDDDARTIDALREHRNDVAHELPKYLVDPNFGVDWRLLERAQSLVKKLGIFWGRIAIDTNPEFDGQDVNDDDIKSGSSLLLDYIVGLAPPASPAAEPREASEPIDLELPLLQSISEALDRRLDELSGELNDSPDPDGFGVLDRIDHVVGLGFVATQNYMTTTLAWYSIPPPGDGLGLGPMHPSGLPVARLVNAAANYWKHCTEWRDPKNAARGERTRRDVSEVVDPEADYATSNLLVRLTEPRPPRFRELLPLLAQWRRSVSATCQRSS